MKMNKLDQLITSYSDSAGSTLRPCMVVLSQRFHMVTLSVARKLSLKTYKHTMQSSEKRSKRPCKMSHALPVNLDY